MNNVSSGNILIWHVIGKASLNRESSSISEHHDFRKRTSWMAWALVFLGFPSYRALPGNRRKNRKILITQCCFGGFPVTTSAGIL